MLSFVLQESLERLCSCTNGVVEPKGMGCSLFADFPWEFGCPFCFLFFGVLLGVIIAEVLALFEEVVEVTTIGALLSSSEKRICPLRRESARRAAWLAEIPVGTSTSSTLTSFEVELDLLGVEVSM